MFCINYLEDRKTINVSLVVYLRVASSDHYCFKFIQVIYKFQTNCRCHCLLMTQLLLLTQRLKKELKVANKDQCKGILL